MKKMLIICSILALFGLQTRLWSDNGGIPQILHIKQLLATEKTMVESEADRNQQLTAEVLDLKQRLDAVEERARNELGFTKEDERFYQIVERR